MYKPKFNSVLIEIYQEDEWGGGNDDTMLGKSFHKGKVISFGEIMRIPDHPTNIDYEDLHIGPDILPAIVGMDIIYNEGAESGTTFDEDGKVYGFIYWWDIRGVRE